MKKFFNPRLTKRVKPKKTLLFYNPSKRRAFIFGIGSAAFLAALGYLLYLYLPLAKEVVAYNLYRLSRKEEVSEGPAVPTPTLPPVPDPAFSIVIPKLNAVSKVIANIDAGNPGIYMEAIREGVAHAAGSGFPGTGKTVYLFAHSTNGEWNAVRYNAVFFLLNDLVPDDEIWLVYNQKLRAYRVIDKKVVSASDVSYLTGYQEGETLILQTCWPPGTILKRLLVFAKPK